MFLKLSEYKYTCVVIFSLTIFCTLALITQFSAYDIIHFIGKYLFLSKNFILTYMIGGFSFLYIAVSLIERRINNWKLFLRFTLLTTLTIFFWRDANLHTGELLSRAVLFRDVSIMATVGFLMLAAVYKIPATTKKCLNALNNLDSPAQINQNFQLWLSVIIVVSCLMTLLNILPNVIRYWDSSGWMDSHGYDAASLNILTGQAPAGDSYYMPLYQYGLAAIYYIFGHFFFVQQFINIILALSTIVLICLAAWNVYRNLFVVGLIGVWAAHTTNLHHAVYLTQIENWYIPLFALSIYAVTRFFRDPSISNLIIFAFSAALLINTRAQGAFCIAFLLLAPLFVRNDSFKIKIRNLILAGAIMAAALTPWTIRNYIHENRLSPVSQQGSIQLAILNDPRVGFYGIRYDINYAEVEKEWLVRYPDATQRLNAQKAYFVERISSEPGWFLEASCWRALAFYGLLPPGVWAPSGPQPTDWSSQGINYVYNAYPAIAVLFATVLGLLAFPRSRIHYYFAGAILANLSIVLFAVSAEPRPSYPSMLLHMMIGLSVFAPPILGCSRAGRTGVQTGTKTSIMFLSKRHIAAFFVTISLSLVIIYFTVGRYNHLRPIMEDTITYDASITVDPNLKDISLALDSTKKDNSGPTALMVGEKYRATVVVSNYMFPPKFHADVLYYPKEATSLEGAQYFYSFVLSSEDGRKSYQLPVTFNGAQFSRKIVEQDIVEISGTIKYITETPFHEYPLVWINVEKAVPASSKTNHD